MAKTNITMHGYETNIIPKIEANIKYPCLGRNKHTGTIVLFSAKGVGTVIIVTSGSTFSVGIHCTVFDDNDFEFLPTLTVTLFNSEE
jgi:hypothetical protein